MSSGRLVCCCGFVGLLGVLAAAVGARGGGKEPPKGAPEVNDKRFHERLLSIARYYPLYGRVDDEFRWAPGLRRMPMAGQVRFSRSKDTATHGQKLYSVFARDRGAYYEVGMFPKAPSTKGQIVIKESWVPEKVLVKPKAVSARITRSRLAYGASNLLEGGPVERRPSRSTVAAPFGKYYPSVKAHHKPQAPARG